MAQEIDELDEEPRLAAACRAHRLGEPAQAGDIAIMADAQQRSAWNIADAGRFDDDRAGPAAGEALVPGHDFVGDDAVFRSAPRHHGRHPASLFELERTGVQR